jgi:hypothetical protein
MRSPTAVHRRPSRGRPGQALPEPLSGRVSFVSAVRLLRWPVPCLARRRVRRRPQRLEVFEELADTERFGEDVAGAGVQRGLPVRLGGPGQQQD